MINLASSCNERKFVHAIQVVVDMDTVMEVEAMVTHMMEAMDTHITPPGLNLIRLPEKPSLMVPCQTHKEPLVTVTRMHTSVKHMVKMKPKERMQIPS